MLAHNPKKRIFFNVVSLFLITIISLFSFACDGQNDSSSNDDHITGPYYAFGVSFETNQEFGEFYNEFKKQNPYQTFSFDLDENELFKDKKYEFTCVPFNHSIKTSDNLYDYKYDSILFEYSFSYITDSEIVYDFPYRIEKECVDIECSTTGWKDIDVELENLNYNLKEVTTDIGHCGIYNYSVSCGEKEVLTIKIGFLNNSQNNAEDYANNVLEILKQTMVILK